MKTRKPSRKLNRYTTLPVLLDLLRREKIFLLDPSTWEDKSDARILLEYKEREGVKLFAICFSIGNETIHQWNTYASGISGCCIEFDEKKLLASFENIKEVRKGRVAYKTISEFEDNPVGLERALFVKRLPYQPEREFRILWIGNTDEKTICVDINLNSINKITISQKMPVDVYHSVKELLLDEIQGIPIKINRSTIYENIRWIKAAKT